MEKSGRTSMALPTKPRQIQLLNSSHTGEVRVTSLWRSASRMRIAALAIGNSDSRDRTLGDAPVELRADRARVVSLQPERDA